MSLNKVWKPRGCCDFKGTHTRLNFFHCDPKYIEISLDKPLKIWYNSSVNPLERERIVKLNKVARAPLWGHSRSAIVGPIRSTNPLECHFRLL